MRMDYYETLQVAPDADPEVIRSAYRALTKKHHPDGRSGCTTAEEKMRQINEAWSILRDPIARAAYDAQRGPTQTRPSPSEPIEKSDPVSRPHQPPRSDSERSASTTQDVRASQVMPFADLFVFVGWLGAVWALCIAMWQLLILDFNSDADPRGPYMLRGVLWLIASTLFVTSGYKLRGLASQVTPPTPLLGAICGAWTFLVVGFGFGAAHGISRGSVPLNMERSRRPPETRHDGVCAIT